MTKEDRDLQRKLKVLRHAEKTDHVARTCRYFVPRERRRRAPSPDGHVELRTGRSP